MGTIDKPVMGFRSWYAKRVNSDGKLYSIMWPWSLPHGEGWDARVQEAHCRRDEIFFPSLILDDHKKSPDARCKCGLHAYYTYEQTRKDAVTASSYMRGIVSGWGQRFVLDDKGFRSEFMRVEAIIDDADKPGLCKQVGARYGVPVIQREDVNLFLALSGGVLITPKEVAA